MEKLTHAHLCELGAKWLKKHTENMVIPNCSVVAKELTALIDSGEIPDIIGWCYWTSVLIEVKVSRADFLKDKKKPFRKNPSEGIGEFRYYLCPENLIKENELPENWGLLYASEKEKISIIKFATRQDANHACEKAMLLSIIKRSIKNEKI